MRRWIDGVGVSISIHFLFSHVGGWQLSHEQAGACITANERQRVCTLIIFQHPLKKKGQENKGEPGTLSKISKCGEDFLSMAMLTTCDYFSTELFLIDIHSL